MLSSLTKLASYTILLLLSQSAAGTLIFDTTNNAPSEALMQELSVFSAISKTSADPLPSLQNPDQAKRVLHNLEKEFRETGELRNIIDLAPRIIELLPYESSIRYMHVIALIAKGDTDSARQIMSEQKKKNASDTIYALMAQAAMARSAGKLSEASAAANKAISADARHPYPYNLLGQIEVTQQHYAKALANFQAAVRYAPKFAAGWSNLGATQFLQGDSYTAETSFSTAIKLSPDYCAPLIGRATISESRGYIESAIADLEVCIKSQPEQLLANKKLVALYLQTARLDDAEKIAQSLAMQDESFSKTVLADIYLRQNQPGEARSQLQSISSPDAQVYYLLSFCDMLEGKEKDAVKHIKQAEKLLPDSATLKITSLIFTFYAGSPVDQKNLIKLSKDAIIGKLATFVAGNVQAATGDMKQAYELWNKAEGVMPGFILDGVPFSQVSKSLTTEEQRFLALGMLYSLKNLYPASLSEFNKALTTNPNSFLANYFSATVYAQAGNKIEVAKHLKRSLRQAPGFFPANYMLAEVYLQKRDIDSAIKYYQAATDSKADGGVLIKLGLLYEQKNHKKGAATAYRKFIEHYPDNFIGYNQLAWMYTRDGKQLDEALKLAKKADELQPGNAGVNDTLGWIYFQKSEYSIAKKYLVLANKTSGGNNADILFHLASLEDALGNAESAKALVEKALKKSVNFESISQAKELLKKLQRK